MRIEKKEYIFYLSEIYFHLYSEHRLENKQYPLEMQLEIIIKKIMKN